jgi:succinate dehydrogenase/fumarate reductase-like Fe-S protein
VRDLIVDRSRMFKDLKGVKAWIDLGSSLTKLRQAAPVAGEPRPARSPLH